MKRGICIIIIAMFLIGICIYEQVLVNNTLSGLNEQSVNLYLQTKDLENVNTNLVLEKSRQINDFWNKNEDKLCFFINHKDMHEMGNELIKMISYSKNNNKEEFLTSLELVIYYSETFHHIMGLSLQNLIWLKSKWNKKACNNFNFSVKFAHFFNSGYFMSLHPYSKF